MPIQYNNLLEPVDSLGTIVTFVSKNMDDYREEGNMAMAINIVVVVVLNFSFAK